MRVKVTSRSFSRSPELVDALQALFDTCVFRQGGPPRLAGAQLAEFLSDADAAVVGLDPVDDAVLAACPNLRAVAKYGVGLDNIDVEACRRRGVYVGWTPGVNRRSVAELVLGSMLMLLRNAYATSLQLKQGTWNKQGGVQLTGKTVGIVGVGHIGKELVELLRPFRCRILGNDIREQGDYYRAVGVEEASLGTVLAESDVVSIHTPLTERTHHLFDERALRAMKPGAFLVNTARGPVVSRTALEKALREGWIAGAMLDVYDDVEPPGHTALLELENVICTPHIGGNAREGVLAMGQAAIDHLERWLAACRNEESACLSTS